MTDAAITIPDITAANAGAVAALAFASMKGEKFEDRETLMQSFVTALRATRDAERAKVKKTRPRLELPKLIEESLGKALGDLSNVRFPLIENVTIKVGDLFRIANDENHDLNKAAARFVETHGLILKMEDAGSRGKGKQVLRRDPKWVAPTVEAEASEGESQEGAQASEELADAVEGSEMNAEGQGNTEEVQAPSNEPEASDEKSQDAPKGKAKKNA